MLVAKAGLPLDCRLDGCQCFGLFGVLGERVLVGHLRRACLSSIQDGHNGGLLVQPQLL